MKQTDNRQKALQQLKAQKGHLLSFRDKSHLHQDEGSSTKSLGKKSVELGEAMPKPISDIKPKVGRNDPCPCGSGKKYKKCCLEKISS